MIETDSCCVIIQCHQMSLEESVYHFQIDGAILNDVTVMRRLSGCLFNLTWIYFEWPQPALLLPPHNNFVLYRRFVCCFDNVHGVTQCCIDRSWSLAMMLFWLLSAHTEHVLYVCVCVSLSLSLVCVCVCVCKAQTHTALVGTEKLNLTHSSKSYSIYSFIVMRTCSHFTTLAYIMKFFYRLSSFLISLIVYNGFFVSFYLSIIGKWH